jgi:hypothetical protein
VEQARCLRCGHQEADLAATSGLAEDRDVARIAPEGCGVLANPHERIDKIQQSGVPRTRVPLGSQLVQVQVPEGTQPVVQRDDDDVALRREGSAVEQGRRPRAEGVGAAVQPDHHGPRTCVLDCWRPHVEDQAVLVFPLPGRWVAPELQLVGGNRVLTAPAHLRAGGTEVGRVEQITPGLQSRRTSEPTGSGHRPRVWEPLEAADPLNAATLHETVTCRCDDGLKRVSGGRHAASFDVGHWSGCLPVLAPEGGPTRPALR